MSSEINKIIQKIQSYSGNKTTIVAFSGGMDSTVVLELAKRAVGREKVLAVHIDFGQFTYEKARENIQKYLDCQSLNLKVISGEEEQAEIMKGGPDCNLCTKKAKLKKVQEFAEGKIILTGSNQSDSWGKFGKEFCNGFFAPLFYSTKKDIQNIADELSLNIYRIGENEYREGCKLKHLLKPMVNLRYHGKAVSQANELLMKRLREKGITAKMANVKIVGPLSRNIGLINVFPYPAQTDLESVRKEIERLEEIDECVLVRRPLRLFIKANKGLFNNMHSRYWVETGRLQPEFAVPLEFYWSLTTNHKLKTFQVINYNIKENE